MASTDVRMGKGILRMQRIYLDHTATTPLDPRALAAMQPFLGAAFGNASSAHWHGRQAKAALEEARGTVARAIGAHPSEIFFTSGGTEADNLAILGIAHGRTHPRIVTDAAEHHAVLDSCLYLRGHGADVVVLPVDETGRVDLSRTAEVLTPGTQLISIMHANNEVGTIQPIREIAALAAARNVLVHTDAVQSAGKIAVNVEDLGVHLLTLSAHKLGGPKGIGALFIRRGADLEPLVHGGGQERGKRPGTENIAMAVGFAEALRCAVDERETGMKRLSGLRDMLEREMLRLFPGVIINGYRDGRLPHLLSISFNAVEYPMEGEMLVTNMDLEGISVSSGSACSSGSIQPSHVLLAMGRDEATAKATLRFSFGNTNSESDIPVIVSAVKSVVARMVVRR
jgi:cysteine desulfurase